MREPQILLLLRVNTAGEARKWARQFMTVMSRHTETHAVCRMAGSSTEEQRPSSWEGAVSQVERWLEGPADVAIALSQAVRCPSDPQLDRFGCTSGIVWHGPSQSLRMSLLVGTQSLFLAQAVGWDDARRRSGWMRALADELWDAVSPEILAADFEVGELINPETQLLLGLPWLLYARSIQRFQHALEGIAGAGHRGKDGEALCALLKRHAHAVTCNVAGDVKACFTETIDGYRPDGGTLSAQTALLREWQG